MTKNFARYLTCLIAKDLDSRTSTCISSYECELIEQKFIDNKFDEIELYVMNKILKPTRSEDNE